MEEWLVEKGGKKKYITERNGRSSWKLQGIVAFCTCQCGMNEWFRLLQWWCDCQATCSPASSWSKSLPFFTFIYYLTIIGAKSVVKLVHICRTVLFLHRRPSCCVLKIIDTWLHEQMIFPNYCFIFQQLIYGLSSILPHKYFRIYTDLHPLCGNNLR